MNHTEVTHAVLSIPPLSAATAAITGYLPAIAGVVSILWIAVQAYYFFKDRKGKK